MLPSMTRMRQNGTRANFEKSFHGQERFQESSTASTPKQSRVLVIGAGMSGILLVIKLREAGFDNVTVFEKGNRPGGTWRDNTYPGLKCDVPAHMFTYSFEPNPEYSHRFPLGSEIQDYLMRVYEKYNVGSAVQFNRVVDSCNFEDGFWYVQTQDGEIHTFDVVISATGILHTPKYPDIEGLDTFEGIAFHTARWNHDVSLKGKRIGIIGTGSTAAQIVPELVPQAEHVALFQRTPQWIFPMPNKAYSQAEKDSLGKNPALAKRLRQRYSKVFQWTFARAVVGNPWLLSGIEFLCRRNLRRKIKDPALRQRLTPPFRAGCKRLIFAKGFYEAIQQKNAAIVDQPISRIEASGVRTSDGCVHPLDVLIFATGYEAHNYMRPIVVRGRDGVSLNDTWSQGAFAHRSTSIPGFPNFFMLFGPYSPIGNFSAISVAEVQCAYVIKQLNSLRETGNDIIEACPAVTQTLLNKIRKRLRNTVWLSGCASWYMDSSGNVPMWPWTFERFVKELSKVNLCEFYLSRRIDCPVAPEIIRAALPAVQSDELGSVSSTPP